MTSHDPLKLGRCSPSWKKQTLPIGALFLTIGRTFVLLSGYTIDTYVRSTVHICFYIINSAYYLLPTVLKRTVMRVVRDSPPAYLFTTLSARQPVGFGKLRNVGRG